MTLEQLIALDREATQGPWHDVKVSSGPHGIWGVFRQSYYDKWRDHVHDKSAAIGFETHTKEDARLIAALRNAAPALLEFAARTEAVTDSKGFQRQLTKEEEAVNWEVAALLNALSKIEVPK